MRIAFMPTSRLIGGVAHFCSPVAVPDPPLELTQLMLCSPALAAAVPETKIVLAEVRKVVEDGDVICRVGGVPAFGVGEIGFGAGAGAGAGVGVGAGAGVGAGVGVGVGDGGGGGMLPEPSLVRTVYTC